MITKYPLIASFCSSLAARKNLAATKIQNHFKGFKQRKTYKTRTSSIKDIVEGAMKLNISKEVGSLTQNIENVLKWVDNADIFKKL